MSTMQNYNSGMEPDYADPYVQYAKLCAQQMDTSDYEAQQVIKEITAPESNEQYNIQQENTEINTELAALQYEAETSSSVQEQTPNEENKQVSDLSIESQNVPINSNAIENNLEANEHSLNLDLNLIEANETPEKDSLKYVEDLEVREKDSAIESEEVKSATEDVSSKDVCRICMDTGVLISVFKDGDKMKMCEKVMACAAVQVSQNDGLPEFICNSCAYDLEIAFKFKTRCESSDTALREKLGLKKKTIVKTEFVLIDCDNEPLISDDDVALKKRPRYREDDGEEEFSEQESDDPNYGAAKNKNKKRKKRRSKRFSVTSKSSSSSKKKNKKVKEVIKVKEDSDDDVIEVTKRPIKRRGEDSQVAGKYPCTYCEKTFPYPSVLKLHIVTHTKEKAHKCVICAKAFMYSKELYTHYKEAHPNEYGKVMEDKNKQYPCGSCDKVFGQKRNLKVHEVVHVREKKYKCESCSQGFTNMTTLNMHKKQDHPGLTKPFRCTICDKRFKQQAALERHMENHRHQTQMAKMIEEKKPPSTKDLFKSIAPVTTTYWSDSFSD